MLWLWFFSYFITKDKNLYIFVPNLWKWFNGNSKALFLYYKKYLPEKRIYYISEWNIYDMNMDIVDMSYYMLFLRSSKIFIDGTLWDVLPLTMILGRFNIIHTWHGEPLKKLWFSDSMIKASMLDLTVLKYFYTSKLFMWFVWNPNSQRDMSDAFPGLDFQITWLARNDIFYHHFLEYYNLQHTFSGYQKVILYAPTWRDTQRHITPFTTWFLSQLNVYLCDNNYLLLVKWHLNTDDLHIDNFSHISNISHTDYDIQEILKYTDILITDYSSTYIDYLLTHRPIVFYCYDLVSYLTHDREMYYTYDDVILTDTKAEDEHQLFDILQNIDGIQEKPSYQDQYRHLLKFFHTYQDWKNCNRIVDILEDF